MKSINKKVISAISVGIIGMSLLTGNAAAAQTESFRSNKLMGIGDCAYTFSLDNFGMQLKLNYYMKPTFDQYYWQAAATYYFWYDIYNYNDSKCISLSTELDLLKSTSKTYWDAKQFIDKMVSEQKYYTENDGSKFGSRLRVISANDTTVGNVTAYQVTYRITEYLDRYWSKGSYKIVKLIGFAKGNNVYYIDANESQYNWSDDFWARMEDVRTGILF